MTRPVLLRSQSRPPPHHARRIAPRSLRAVVAMTVAMTVAAAPGWALTAAVLGAGMAGATSTAGADSVGVTFLVRVPASTPTGDRLYLAGNLVELGPWDPGKVALERVTPRLHALTLRLRVGVQLEYKITRGSWNTVEKGSSGEEIANRRLAVAAAETARIEVATWRDQTASAAQPRASTLTGDVRHLGRIRSELMDNTRDVWVYLPPSYGGDPERRYPVVYFHDGQNVFDAATAFIGVEWEADETLQRLAADRSLEEIIAVAIANTPARVAEYTQAVDPQHATPAMADLYLRFLVEELKPRVDAAYRTRTEREHTALVGSSLGGLVSLYAGIAAWRTFGLVAGLSPVVQWGDHDLERRYQTAAAAELPLRMWIDMGTAEVPADAGASQALVDELRRFRDVLLARGYQSGQTLQTVEAQGAAHDERAWSRRLPDALRFLLGPPASR